MTCSCNQTTEVNFYTLLVIKHLFKAVGAAKMKQLDANNDFFSKIPENLTGA